jgi:hypothetical protein
MRVDRRRLLELVGSLTVSIAGGALTSESGAQALLPVRLLLLRRLGLSPSGQCTAPCVRGSLYDVSDLKGRALDDALIPLMGTRAALCDVIERPWKNNAPNVSAIPRGVYAATVRDDRSKPWMTNENRAWRLELGGTGHRSNIQFHYGQDVAWSEGCFIVGALLQADDGAGLAAKYCALSDAEKAVSTIRAAVTAIGRDSKDIKIGVADHGGLFPDYKVNTPCPSVLLRSDVP